MKIYFAGSITGGRGDKELYLEIINLLKKHGTVLTEHVGAQTLSAMGNVDLTDEFTYERCMNWTKEADVIVAEVTTPSLGVGYEIGEMSGIKPILCLYRLQDGKRVSRMLTGNKNLQTEKYETIKDIETILENFFKNFYANDKTNLS